jgi:hypothetical protein
MEVTFRAAAGLRRSPRGPAAIGLVLPAALDVAPVLVPPAATGFVVLMVGAIITHARRKETQSIVVNAVLLVLAAVVLWGRFGPYSF